MRNAAVISADDNPMQRIPDSSISYRVPVDRDSTGCQNLIQRVFKYESGISPEMKNTESDDVIYIVSGSGEATVDGQNYALLPSTGLLIPANTTYTIRNFGSETLELVSVLSPQPGYAANVQPSPEAKLPDKLTVHESEQEALHAGTERTFKLMIDPRHGSKYVTQFIGFIEQSHAPFHTHLYEEVIYILGGEGIIHIEDGDFPIRPGSSIYLSPGTRHCLENTRQETLRLLGVFCPAGSPGDHETVGDD